MDLLSRNVHVNIPAPKAVSLAGIPNFLINLAGNEQ